MIITRASGAQDPKSRLVRDLLDQLDKKRPN
jgi:hypothetical protein